MRYEDTRERIKGYLARWKNETGGYGDVDMSERVFDTSGHVYFLVVGRSELVCFCCDSDGHEFSSSDIFPADVSPKYLLGICSQLPIAAAKLREKLAKFDFDLSVAARALNGEKI